MKEINVLSWGGGTQSTALLLMALKGETKLKPDYIIFSDTGDENNLVYAQIIKVQDYVKKTYNADIVVTKKNKVFLDDNDITKMIKNGELSSQYKTSQFADLYQEQVLFYQGVINQANLVPSWVINKDGELGKMMGRQCTVEYKISQIMKELRVLENVKSFSKKRHQINMMIGFTTDEIRRLKPSPQSYVTNVFPLVDDLNLTKEDCVNYVERELGFKPKSSVCNICYANDFKRCYDLFKNDKVAWDKITYLDNVMEHKNQPKIKAKEVYLFHWQAKKRKRLKDIDMDLEHKERNKYYQLNIYDVMGDYDEEEKNACMGGCFL